MLNRLFSNNSSLLKKRILIFSVISLFLLIPCLIYAANGVPSSAFGIRWEFILFAIILIGVAVFHDKTFWVALIGLTVLLVFKLVFDSEFNFGKHFLGNSPLLDQLINKDLRQGEWPILINLLGLLLGFSILAKHFEGSGIPGILPKYLPHDWTGPFVLLVFIFILSSFLDNIAAALIGGTVAFVVFNKKVHIGYLAAIVAASNAGGAGSVLGDTTTTMMWIDGVSPVNVLHAYIAAFVSLIIFGWFASHQQHKYRPLLKHEKKNTKINFTKLFIVILIIIGAIVTNFLFDLPVLGVWMAIIIGSFVEDVPWRESQKAFRGTIFLLCLVTCASLMPVNELPPASWISTFFIGFVSAVFDNIPLTKLCLDQGCFDWGMLAYAVGFGGSMIWFGSSAGVAICNEYPEARNVGLWIKKAWYIPIAYVAGFFMLYLVMGWEPADNKKVKINECPCVNCPDKPVSMKESLIVKPH
jgi:Na+/H+ antiporter NhaD/arsenite permease-like protein